jgi:hypothetical protein
VAFSLPFESLPGTMLEADGLARAFRAGVVTAPDGTRLGIVRIARFREQDSSPNSCMEAWRERQADGAMSEADVAPVRSAASAAWMQTLAAQLRHFREQKVAAVIADVGGNSGGNDTGDWAARLFTANDVHSARLMMSAAPLAAQYFDEQLAQLRAAQKEKDATPEARAMLEQSIAAFEARKAGIAARHCDLSWVWTEQRPWQPQGCSRLIDAGYASGQAAYLPPKSFGNQTIASSIYWAAGVDGLRGAWNGPAYVLTDSGTASSAEMFAALMHDAVGARTVGRATAAASWRTCRRWNCPAPACATACRTAYGCGPTTATKWPASSRTCRCCRPKARTTAPAPTACSTRWRPTYAPALPPPLRQNLKGS